MQTIFELSLKELPINALEKAVVLRNPVPGLIHHSDRGSQ